MIDEKANLDARLTTGAGVIMLTPVLIGDGDPW